MPQPHNPSAATQHISIIRAAFVTPQSRDLLFHCQAILTASPIASLKMLMMVIMGTASGPMELKAAPMSNDTVMICAAAGGVQIQRQGMPLCPDSSHTQHAFCNKTQPPVLVTSLARIQCSDRPQSRARAASDPTHVYAHRLLTPSTFMLTAAANTLSGKADLMTPRKASTGLCWPVLAA